jgi:DNA repair photolyase
MSIIYEPRGKAREYASLAANLYAGCGHGCLYCYAPCATFKHRDFFYNEPTPRKNVMEQLRKDAVKFAGQGSVLFSFTTDPYQPIDSVHALTRKGIEILHENGLSVEILTKGGCRASRDFDLLTPDDKFATTLTFFKPADSEKWEPGAASPQDRIRTIQKAKQKGLTTWASLEPVIDPAQSLELIRQTASHVDLFKVGKINHHPVSKTIDWKKFAHDAVNLLEQRNKKYYIKDDLRAFL